MLKIENAGYCAVCVEITIPIGIPEKIGYNEAER